MLSPTLPTDRKPKTSAQPDALRALLYDAMQEDPTLPQNVQYQRPTIAPPNAGAPVDVSTLMQGVVMPEAPQQYQAVQPQAQAPQQPQRPTLVLPEGPPLPGAPERRDTRMGKGVAIGAGLLSALFAGTGAGALAGGVAQGAAQGVQDDNAWYEEQERLHRDALDRIAERSYADDRTQAIEGYRADLGEYEYERRMRDEAVARQRQTLADQERARLESSFGSQQNEQTQLNRRAEMDYRAGIEERQGQQDHLYTMSEIAARNAGGGSGGSTSSAYGDAYNPQAQINQIDAVLAAGYQIKQEINQYGKPVNVRVPLSPMDRVRYNEERARLAPLAQRQTQRRDPSTLPYGDQPIPASPDEARRQARANLMGRQPTANPFSELGVSDATYQAMSQEDRAQLARELGL